MHSGRMCKAVHACVLFVDMCLQGCMFQPFGLCFDVFNIILSFRCICQINGKWYMSCIYTFSECSLDVILHHT